MTFGNIQWWSENPTLSGNTNKTTKGLWIAKMCLIKAYTATGEDTVSAETAKVTMRMEAKNCGSSFGVVTKLKIHRNCSRMVNEWHIKWQHGL